MVSRRVATSKAARYEVSLAEQTVSAARGSLARRLTGGRWQRTGGAASPAASLDAFHATVASRVGHRVDSPRAIPILRMGPLATGSRRYGQGCVVRLIRTRPLFASTTSTAFCPGLQTTNVPICSAPFNSRA